MRLGPLLVGCALGLISFGTTGLVEGYTGAGINPARCLAFSVARGSFQSMLRNLKQRVQFTETAFQVIGFGGWDHWQAGLCKV